MRLEKLKVGDCFELDQTTTKLAPGRHYMIVDMYHEVEEHSDHWTSIVVHFECMSTRGVMATYRDSILVKEILQDSFIMAEDNWRVRGRTQAKEKRNRRRSNRSSKGKRNVDRELQATAL